MEDCSSSSALAMELLQSCTKLSLLQWSLMIIQSEVWFSIKMPSCQYMKSHWRNKTFVKSSCLVQPAVRDNSWVSEIMTCDPTLGMRQLFGYVTKGQWHHNQLTWLGDLFTPNIYSRFRHMNTYDKEFMTPRCHRTMSVQLCLIYLYIDGTRILVDGIQNIANK